ncbi:MAG TPA: macro domain-containing protein [bacterium]|nr:macro domain-containing protein [bacterium]
MTSVQPIQLVCGTTVIALRQGDIATFAADAIVTAANTGLRGGGGVDGAVHRAAGPQLLAACRLLGGCPTGSAVITPAFALAGVRQVIHAVGPIWRGGGRHEDELLAGAYRAALDLARDHGCRTVLFPSISTGVYGFPVDRAAPLALHTAIAFVRQQPAAFACITWVLFDAGTCAAYQQALCDCRYP